MIPELNDSEWYKEIVKLDIDRISLLNIVACLELTLRHPQLPQNTRDHGRYIGRVLLLRLISDGLIVPDDAKRQWLETFGIIF